MTSRTQPISKFAALASIGLLVLIVGLFAQPYNPANAQVGSAITCNLSFGSMTGGMGSSEVPVHEKNSDTQKGVSCTWKGIAWQIAHTVLHELTSSVVNWINSGFKGSPSFLTNPGKFFTKMADDVTGDLIADAGPLVQQLCSPLSLNIRLGLAIGQANDNNENQYKCTLSTIIAAQKQDSVSVGVSQTANGLTLGDIINGNAASSTYMMNSPGVLSVNGQSVNRADAQVSDCLNGNFNRCGGWSGFGSIVTGPQNSGASARLIARDDLIARQEAQAKAANKDLDRGNGFMSWQSCDNVANPSSGAGATKQVCTTQTPGSFINSSLSKATGASVDELNMTNDLNQVVSALFSQLLSKTLNGGLYASAQGSGSYSSGAGMTSYIDQLSSDPALQQNLNSLNSQQAAIVNSYSAPVIQYISLENQTLNLLNNELVKFDAVRSCLDSKLTMKPTNVSQAQVDTFDRIEQQQIIASITLTQESIDNASSTLDQIHVVANKVQNSATVIDLSNTSTEYGQQIAALSNSVDPAAAQDDLTAVTARMKTLDSTLATYQNLCNNNYY